jgi:hypothetical protein
MQTGVPLTSQSIEEVPYDFMINARFYVLTVVLMRVQIFENVRQSQLADLQKFWSTEMVSSSVSSRESRVSNTEISKFHSNPPHERVRADGRTDSLTNRQTDRVDEVSSRFSQFCERAQIPLSIVIL